MILKNYKILFYSYLCVLVVILIVAPTVLAMQATYIENAEEQFSKKTLEINSINFINEEKNTENSIKSRKKTYHTLSFKLKSLNDEQLLEALEKTEPVHSGVGGASVVLKLDGRLIFVKKIPLTDIEMLPENKMSTANLFELPLYYQYCIGSAGFGAWRELAAHVMTTDWVLKDECPNFPLLYDWRVLPNLTKKMPTSKENYNIRLIHDPLFLDSLSLIEQGELALFYERNELYCKYSDKEKMQIIKADDISIQGINSKTFDRVIKILKEGKKQQNLKNVGVITEEDKEELLRFTTLCGYTPSKLDRIVERWGGSSAIRARIEMIENASANLVLFLEYIPETLEQWLERRFFKEGHNDESALLMVEKELKAIASFIKEHNFLHFDAHFKNILTDGHRLYLADFGLTTSSIFKLTDAEIKFVEAHRDYDQYYIRGLWANWIGKIFFGKENFKSKLHGYAIGKGEKLASPLATTILKRDAQTFILMDAFFKELINEVKAKRMLDSEPAFKNFLKFNSVHEKL